MRDHLNNRPTQAQLSSDITALLGKETTEKVVKTLIARLQNEGLVVVRGKKIEYDIPIGSK